MLNSPGCWSCSADMNTNKREAQDTSRDFCNQRYKFVFFFKSSFYPSTLPTKARRCPTILPFIPVLWMTVLLTLWKIPFRLVHLDELIARSLWLNKTYYWQRRKITNSAQCGGALCQVNAVRLQEEVESLISGPHCWKVAAVNGNKCRKRKICQEEYHSHRENSRMILLKGVSQNDILAQVKVLWLIFKKPFVTSKLSNAIKLQHWT